MSLIGTKQTVTSSSVPQITFKFNLILNVKIYDTDYSKLFETVILFCWRSPFPLLRTSKINFLVFSKMSEKQNMFEIETLRKGEKSTFFVWRTSFNKMNQKKSEKTTNKLHSVCHGNDALCTSEMDPSNDLRNSLYFTVKTCSCLIKIVKLIQGSQKGHVTTQTKNGWLFRNCCS